MDAKRPKTSQTQFQRLPAEVQPVHYSLNFTPDLDAFIFSGKADISVTISEEVSSITLNCAEIDIKGDTVMFCDATKELQGAYTMLYKAAEETVKFNFTSPLKPGVGSLSFTFTGVLNNRMKGFYRSTYLNAAGEKRTMATTMFAPIDARRAFPCWDEPAIKATFAVTMTIPEELTALSNTAIFKTTPLAGKIKSVLFERTPSMSAYLLAFVVGEFDFVEDFCGKVRVRVYTTPGCGEQGRFALSVATRSLKFYENYFQIPYPLGKLDLLAVPDFPCGAMENWGLVIYRVMALLVDDVKTSRLDKQHVALVIAHELAHQWFGNLVTMEWWTHLWLNEGFAKWVEFFCVDHLFPEWEIWCGYAAVHRSRAFALDSLNSTHPVEVEVTNPASINEIFDAITYCKGSAVVGMVHGFVGPDNFKKGLQNYLTAYSYGHATTSDLWRALEKTSGLDVGRVMSAFTLRSGHPVVSLELCAGGKELRICQSCILDNSGDQVWPIPVSIYSGKTGKVIQLLLETSETDVPIPAICDDDYWVLNYNASSFHRCSYSNDLFARLLPRVRSRSIPTVDRLALLEDTRSLCEADLGVAVETVLRMLLEYREEVSEAVWLSVASSHDSLRGILTTHLSFDADAFTTALFSSLHARLGWEKVDGEDESDETMRALAVRQLGKVGGDVLRIAREKMMSKTLTPEMHKAVYYVVAKHGDVSTFEKFLGLARAETSQDERLALFYSAARVNNTTTRRRLLDLILMEEIAVQDCAQVVAAAAEDEGCEETWRWVREKWSELRTLCSSGFVQGRLIAAAAGGLLGVRAGDDVVEFFENKTDAVSAVRQTAERVRVRSDWRERELARSFTLDLTLATAE